MRWNVLLWVLASLWGACALLAELMGTHSETEVLLHHLLAGMFLIGAVIANKLDRQA